MKILKRTVGVILSILFTPAIVMVMNVHEGFPIFSGVLWVTGVVFLCLVGVIGFVALLTWLFK